MLLLQTLLLVGAAASNQVSVSLQPVPPSVLEARLTPLIQHLSAYHNVSLSLAVRTNLGTAAVTAGLNMRSGSKTMMTPAGKHPLGSVTKSWTACQIMQAHEAGLIDIDAPFSNYVDEILLRLNGTTLSELWDNDPGVKNITARLLMAMRAGLHDYNDTSYSSWTFENPNDNWTPFDMLHALNKSWVCGGPGGCEEYASPGYELLGLALCQLQNCTNYDQLDQMAVLPKSIRSKYTGVAFPQNGPCSQDPTIVHQYALQTTNKTGEGLVARHFDILDYSCLNGWSCGNIAITTTDVAEWFWDIFHGEIVSEESLSQMLNFSALAKGWNPGLKYGLGIMRWQLTKRADPQNLTQTYGHGGADWGSLGLISGYNRKFNFSISLTTNSVCGMNCSDAYRNQFPLYNGAMYDDMFFLSAGCPLYNEVLQVLSNHSLENLNCSFYGGEEVQRLHPKFTRFGRGYGPHHMSPNYTCMYDF